VHFARGKGGAHPLRERRIKQNEPIPIHQSDGDERLLQEDWIVGHYLEQSYVTEEGEGQEHDTKTTGGSANEK